MQRTSIEWSDISANPIRARNKATGKVGWHCVKYGPGCLHCYAESMNHRLGTGLPFLKTAAAAVDVFLDMKVVDRLVRLRDPQRVFLCDMTDLFGDWVPDEWIDLILAAVAANPRITAQILTKRAERLPAYFNAPGRHDAIREAARRAGFKAGPVAEALASLWPLHNLHVGVSVEDRKHGLPRVDYLRQVRAVVRYLSVEPLLGDLGPIRIDGIDWVILGGESGHDANPMHTDWARWVRDRCVAAGVPFFFKQWGTWRPDGQGPEWLRDAIGARNAHVARALFPDGRHSPDLTGRGTNGDGAIVVRKMGKKRAGRLLDGRTWDELPSPRMAV